MEKLNKFEKAFVEYKTGKRMCKKYHKIIEDKYIKIFGKEDYETRKEETQKGLYNHYKILNSDIQVVKAKRCKTLEQFESEPEYLHILPYVKKKVFEYFKEQGIEIQNIEHFIELCKN